MTLWSALLEIVVPDACVLCEAPVVGLSPSGVCAACMRLLPKTVSRVSGPPNLVGMVSMGPYEGVLGAMVRHGKYTPKMGVFDVLGGHLGEALEGRFNVDVVTHVPIPWTRCWHRGFDQGERIGRAISARVGIPFRQLVCRRHKAQQVGKGSVERKALPVSAFGLLSDDIPERVLLVDDVRTTGASLDAVASALRLGGASSIWGATLCHQNVERKLYK